MAQEEKLKEAKKLYETANPDQKYVLERLFPELAKSEDEKIMKSLINYIYCHGDAGDFTKKEFIAWVEKQGNKDEEILILKDQIESLHAAIKAIKETHKIELEKRGEQKLVKCHMEWYDFVRWFVKERTNNYTLIPSDADIHTWGGIILEHAKKELEKQDKQKPAEWHREDEQNLNVCLAYISDEFLRRWLKDVIYAKYDEIKPVFRIGDTISNGISEVKIVSIDKNYYIVTNDEIENDANVCNWVVYFKNQDDWKLVKQKSIDKAEPRFKVKYAGSEYNVFEVKDIGNITYYGIEDEPNHIDYVKADSCEIISGDNDIKENSFSIPTKSIVFSDKVESKFHNSDWVVTSYGKVNQVVSVDKDGDGYTLDDGVYFSGSWSDMYHIWTIKDAKDGDILFTSSTASHEIFIFKSIDENGNVKCYFSYDSEDGFREGKYHFIGSATNCKPATKEQRDILFQMMKKAGYKWNAEKKELKKIL